MPSCSHAAPLPERTLFSAADAEQLMLGLNHIPGFPVPLSVLERQSGVTFADHVEVGSFMHQYGQGLALSFTCTRSGEKDWLLQSVEIKRTGDDLQLPTPPPQSVRFDVGTYTYLPTIEYVRPVGEGYYRHFRHEGRARGESAPIREWSYVIDKKRGPFLTDAEKQGMQREILALLRAIREDRFVAAYEAFLARFPENDLGSHELYGHTVTIMQFDDRNEQYRSDHLKKDGLIAYVGIHVYNEAQSEARYPHLYLFDFFGLERLDARPFYKGKPYNPNVDQPHSAHPLADLTNPLPDISAAGDRDGGLAYYAYLEHRADGWSFECPGFYPHDGKTVATSLDPNLLQFGGFTVTHSRPRTTSGR